MCYCENGTGLGQIPRSALVRRWQADILTDPRFASRRRSAPVPVVGTPAPAPSSGNGLITDFKRAAERLQQKPPTTVEEAAPIRYQPEAPVSSTGEVPVSYVTEGGGGSGSGPISVVVEAPGAAGAVTTPDQPGRGFGMVEAGIAAGLAALLAAAWSRRK